MRSLFDYIDRRTFEAACDRLGIQPERFGQEFSPRLAAYTAELEAYVTRMQARDDQILAAALFFVDRVVVQIDVQICTHWSPHRYVA